MFSNLMNFVRTSALAVAVCGAHAYGGAIDLTSGAAGTFLPGQSFNETRAVDARVLSASGLSVVGMRLDNFSIGSGSALVGARIYSSVGALIASADATVTSGGSVTIPISASLASGSVYRIGFYLQTTPANQGNGTLFDPSPAGPGGMPYTVSTGELRIEAAWAFPADSFPTNVNFGVSGITVYTTFGTPFCFPGVGGVTTCPCGNPPFGTGTGCNNFGPNPAGGTGGANLACSGVAALTADSLQFHVTDEIVNTSNVSVLWQGTTALPVGSPSGAGVRCVAGTLVRLYKGNAFSGAIDFPSGPVANVHSMSAAKGFPIGAPVTLHYYVAYRNAAAGAPCGSPLLAFNTTNAMSVAWLP